jgi:nicotinic acid mononucleotide adenylyltransferase
MKMMCETPGKSIRDMCLQIKDFYVKFIIFDRGNDGFDLIQSKIPFWAKDHFIWKKDKFNISSTEIRNAKISK